MRLVPWTRGGRIAAIALLAGAACRERAAAPREAAVPAAATAADPFAPLPAASGPPAHAGREGLTDSRRFLVSWTPVPDPIPLNAMFGAELRVKAADGSALPADAEVTVDAGMPGHGHGMTVRPRTTARGDGSFEVRGLLFHMPGAWVVTVKVAQGGSSDVARFAVDVR
jgi:hypothetical protein